jgi:hypothetical protein
MRNVGWLVLVVMAWVARGPGAWAGDEFTGPTLAELVAPVYQACVPTARLECVMDEDGCVQLIGTVSHVEDLETIDLVTRALADQYGIEVVPRVAVGRCLITLEGLQVFRVVRAALDEARPPEPSSAPVADGAWIGLVDDAGRDAWAECCQGLQQKECGHVLQGPINWSCWPGRCETVSLTSQLSRVPFLNDPIDWGQRPTNGQAGIGFKGSVHGDHIWLSFGPPLATASAAPEPWARRLRVESGQSVVLRVPMPWVSPENGEPRDAKEATDDIVLIATVRAKMLPPD